MAGAQITFSASASADPSPDDVLTYQWDWDDDGDWDETTTSAIITHTWQAARVYTVTLGVTDDDGGQDSDTTLVTITPGNLSRIEIAPSETSVTAGQSISYTLSAYDAHANSWDVTASGNYTMSLAAGGEWTANVYTAAIAGDWTITAAYGGQSATATLTVRPGALNRIAIQDASGGTGNAITAHTMTSGQNLQVWAAGYDASDNYIGAIPVQWTGTGIASSLLSPTSGISATFSADAPGDGTIIADDGSGHAAATGTITVVPDQVDAPAKFTIEIPESSQAGRPFPATITAQDDGDNTLLSFNGTVNLSTTTGGTISPSQGTLQNGAWTGTIALSDPGKARDVIVTDSSGPGTGSATINLNWSLFMSVILN